MLLLLLAGSAWAQSSYESGLTNKVVPFSSTVIVPQVTVPHVAAPQPQAVEVYSVTNPPTPNPQTHKMIGPFQSSSPYLPPSVSDIASRTVRPMAPPLPPANPVLPTAAQPAEAEPSTPSGGKYRHVSADGSDEGDGTRNHPWKSLQHAAEAAQPGDIVTVRPGTYEGFHTVRSGEARRPITFRALGNVVLVPLGGQVPENFQANSEQDLYRLDNVHINKTDYIVIDGFHIERAGRCGIFAAESRGIVLENNVIGPVATFGILTGFCTDLQVISNKTFGAAGQHGIYVSNSREPNDNPVIRANESYNNHQCGIQVNGDCKMGGDGNITGALIENNVVHDNGYKGMSLISMSDSVVQNNLIYKNGKLGGAGGIHLTDELGCGQPSSGNVIVNNTVVEPSIACLRITDGAKTNGVFNNIFVGPHPVVDEVGDNKIDEHSNVSAESAVGIFNNPEAGDYHILITSPAKNIGLATFQGKAAPAYDRQGVWRGAVMTLDAGAN